MRYPDGGGLTASGRARRAQVRLQAAAMFEQHVAPGEVARTLRVSTKWVYQWRRAWLGRGPALDAGTGDTVDRRVVPRVYTLHGTSYLLHRMGWTPQIPRHRAVERDEDEVTTWRTETWAKVRG